MAELLRSAVRTRDREAATEAFRTIVAHRPRFAVAGRDVDFWVRSAGFGDFRADLARARGVHYSSISEPIDHLLGGVVVAGSGRHRTGQQELRVARGDGFLYPLGLPVENEHHDAELAMVSLPLTRAGQVAEETIGLPAAGVTFRDMSPVSAEMGRYWHDTITFVHRQLTLSDSELPPLILDHLHQLVSAAAVVVFPNTSMTVSYLPGGGQASSAAVRRALAFIEANAARGLTVSEIAEAAGVGPRALQAAFRRSLDTTPMHHLRRVRLEHAHHDLTAADPRAGGSVAAIARRWGFLNLGRFAGLYRAVYGRTPYQTLRGK